MKCGSTSPVTILRSASAKRRSSFTGVPAAVGPEVDVRGVVARVVVLDPHRPQHPRVAHQLASSAPTFGRWSPVATSTGCARGATPASSRVRTIGPAGTARSGPAG